MSKENWRWVHLLNIEAFNHHHLKKIQETEYYESDEELFLRG